MNLDKVIADCAELFGEIIEKESFEIKHAKINLNLVKHDRELKCDSLCEILEVWK